MNFEEYWKQEEEHNKKEFPEYPFLACEVVAAQKAWKVCKKEILKVLKEDEITYYEACAQGTIEQIEKL